MTGLYKRSVQTSSDHKHSSTVLSNSRVWRLCWCRTVSSNLAHRPLARTASKSAKIERLFADTLGRTTMLASSSLARFTIDANGNGMRTCAVTAWHRTRPADPRRQCCDCRAIRPIDSRRDGTIRLNSSRRAGCEGARQSRSSHAASLNEGLGWVRVAMCAFLVLGFLPKRFPQRKVLSVSQSHSQASSPSPSSFLLTDSLSLSKCSNTLVSRIYFSIILVLSHSFSLVVTRCQILKHCGSRSLSRSDIPLTRWLSLSTLPPSHPFSLCLSQHSFTFSLSLTHSLVLPLTRDSCLSLSQHCSSLSLCSLCLSLIPCLSHSQSPSITHWLPLSLSRSLPAPLLSALLLSHSYAFSLVSSLSPPNSFSLLSLVVTVSHSPLFVASPCSLVDVSLTRHLALPHSSVTRPPPFPAPLTPFVSHAWHRSLIAPRSHSLSLSFILPLTPSLSHHSVSLSLSLLLLISN